MRLLTSRSGVRASQGASLASCPHHSTLLCSRKETFENVGCKASLFQAAKRNALTFVVVVLSPFEHKAIYPDTQPVQTTACPYLCCHPTITIPCNVFESGQWKALHVPAFSVVEVSRIGCFVLVALTLIPHPPGNPLFAHLQHSCHCLKNSATGTRTWVARVRAEQTIADLGKRSRHSA